MNTLHSKRRPTRSLVAALILVFSRGLLQAQPTADQAWTSLTGLTKVTPVARAVDGIAKTPAQIAADTGQQAAKARQAAQAARSFHQSYPTHSKAAEAKKIEALASIRGVENGDVAQTQAALAVGRQVRGDTSHPLADRVEVALAMERLDLSTKIKQRMASGKIPDWRRIGDQLKREFGDQPGIQNYMMDVARRADLESAAAISREVLASAVANADARGRAQTTLTRSALVGKKIDLRLDIVGGGTVDLGLPAAAPTFLVVWRPSEEPDLGAVKRFERSIPVGARVVYVAHGGHLNAVKKIQSQPGLVAGQHAHAPAGVKSKALSDALALRHADLPLVISFSKSGAVAGIGRISELPTLAQKAGN